ncbi:MULTISPECIES: hypothetical protein [unclassified Nocardioides]|nr:MULTISPECIES: hypothetical protein [unclassified Nocardioides]
MARGDVDHVTVSQGFSGEVPGAGERGGPAFLLALLIGTAIGTVGS